MPRKQMWVALPPSSQNGGSGGTKARLTVLILQSPLSCKVPIRTCAFSKVLRARHWGAGGRSVALAMS